MDRPYSLMGFEMKIAGTGRGRPVRKVVLGLGNLLFMDEGFGIHALQAVQKRLGQVDEIEWADGGVLGLDLLPLVEESSHLLALDAINTGSQPGALTELDRDRIPLFAGIIMSEHQVGFQEVLGLAFLRDAFPAHLHLIGVQPACLEAGVGLSPAAAAALPQVVERACQVLSDW
jgi:hydrogenase maturation protease